ncbi:MAG: hypothetical protein AB1656_01665 [Candidatus Omnitrophota bacterium]
MPEVFNKDIQTFLSDIKSGEEIKQINAWTLAAQMDASVIEPLSDLLVAKELPISKAADEALKRITHSVGKTFSGDRWQSVVDAYIRVVERDHPAWAKAIALRHLSMIAGDSAVNAAAKYLTDPELQEEAVYCLERIPGPAATMALVDGLKKVSAEFEPRVLTALGHRKDPAAVEPVAAEMGSANVKVAIAAMKAAARIGVKPENEPELPDFESLSDRDKAAFVDSYLRFMDQQVKKGEMLEDAMETFRGVLENAESEHFRCAAIVSLSKMGGAEAESLIQAKVDNDSSYIVKITAKKALACMKK